MTELQEIEFGLLQQFLSVCEQLNLTYYLVCGSALGAAKYGGFIPWDDDIDVPNAFGNVRIGNVILDGFKKGMFLISAVIFMNLGRATMTLINAGSCYAITFKNVIRI